MTKSTYPVVSSPVTGVYDRMTVLPSASVNENEMCCPIGKPSFLPAGNANRNLLVLCVIVCFSISSAALKADQSQKSSQSVNHQSKNDAKSPRESLTTNGSTIYDLTTKYAVVNKENKKNAQTNANTSNGTLNKMSVYKNNSMMTNNTDTMKRKGHKNWQRT